MTIDILMPALSPTMTEGKLAKWHVKEGDEVSSGDIVAEIETDKATMEVEAVDEGKVGKLLVAEGTENVAVNQVIAVLLEEGEDASAVKAGGPPAAKPTPKAEAAQAEAPKAEAAKPEPAPAPKKGNGAAPAAPQRAAGERLFASPLAKRMAQQAGIELGALSGSGPHGRIVKRDIEAALEGGVAAKAAAAAPGAAPAAPRAAGPSAKQLADLLGMRYRQEPLTGMRKTIAARLTEAKQTVPHFYLTIDCHIDELLKARKALNARDESLKISVNDFVIRAAALALKKVPAANASWSDNGILYYEQADISVAVATPNGLITPII